MIPNNCSELQLCAYSASSMHLCDIFLFVSLKADKSPEGQFTQLMALPRTLQQKITKLVDPPGKNRDVEEVLLQVAQDPDCGAVVQQGRGEGWRRNGMVSL